MLGNSGAKCWSWATKYHKRGTSLHDHVGQVNVLLEYLRYRSMYIMFNVYIIIQEVSTNFYSALLTYTKPYQTENISPVRPLFTGDSHLPTSHPAFSRLSCRGPSSSLRYRPPNSPPLVSPNTSHSLDGLQPLVSQSSDRSTSSPAFSCNPHRLSFLPFRPSWWPFRIARWLRRRNVDRCIVGLRGYTC